MTDHAPGPMHYHLRAFTSARILGVLPGPRCASVATPFLVVLRATSSFTAPGSCPRDDRESQLDTWGQPPVVRRSRRSGDATA